MIDRIISILNWISGSHRKIRTFNALIIDDSYAARDVAEHIVRETLQDLSVTFKLHIFDSFFEFEKSQLREFDLALVDWNLDRSKTIHGDRVISQIRPKTPMISIMTGQSGQWDVINSYAQDNELGLIKKGKPMQHIPKDGEEEPRYFDDTNVEKEITTFVHASVELFHSQEC